MNYRETITSGQSQQKIVPMSILRKKCNSLRLAEREAISNAFVIEALKARNP